MDKNPMWRDQNGSALIFIIIGMVVVAVIAGALFSQTSTSLFNQAQAQKDAKAYYLSESCIRIAAGEYKAVKSMGGNIHSTLADLHGTTLTMPSGQGTCTLWIYPYWFYSRVSHSANQTPITVFLPGGVPPVARDATEVISFYPGVRLRLYRPASPTINAFAVISSASVGSFSQGIGTMVTFNLTTPFSIALNVNDQFYLGYTYNSTQPPPNSGGNLILNIPTGDTNALTAKMFPPEKGSIFVESSGMISQYQYDERRINSSVNPNTVTLTNIRAVPGAPAPLFPVTINNTPIYMAKSLGFRATSQYGN